VGGVVRAVPAPVQFLDLGVAHARLADELDLAWKSVLASGRFVGGPEVDAFEAEFAEYCGTTSCVGVANGTDALEMVLAALGIGTGDEVILPGNTFVATAEAVCAVGARPRFVDVRPDTLLIDPAATEAAVTPRTAAVIAVHLYGQMGDLSALAGLATRHGLALVEDAAQAHGARFDGRRAGSVGAAGTFSFYPGKNLGGLGDGGAVVSDDADLVARIRRLGNHGRSALQRDRHEVSGRNSRLDSLQAAVLRVKLTGLDKANRARGDLMRRYRAQLPAWCVPVTVHPAAEAVHHLAVVQVPDRDVVTAALDAARIGWGVHYPVPCHRQPAFAAFAEPLRVAEAAAERILSLPLSPTLPPAAVDRVCAVLREAGC
jgi:dTDP-4-amino-4,6-dideoxygalactose transaminase